MPSRLSASEYRQVRKTPVDCPIVHDRVESLADYFSVVDAITNSNDTFWFRGHSEVSWKLVPSALRYEPEATRERALKSLAEFKRIAEMKVPRPPIENEQLKWTQIAQHFGLPTRLLDWTQSATIGLFFACLPPDDTHGLLFILNPETLNALGPAGEPRVLTAQEDAKLIGDYLKLGGRSSRRRGSKVIAINPVWNSERLILQRGGFTLHGTRFDLDQEQAPSLVALPILNVAKARLREQLARIGVDRLTIFPELEHACLYLRSRIEGR